MVWVWVLLGLVILIVIAALSGVRTHIVYTRVHQDDHLNIEIKALFGLVRYCYSLPSIKFEGLARGISIETEHTSNIPIPNKQAQSSKGEINIDQRAVLNWYEKFNALIHHVVGFQHWLVNTLTHTRCTRINWYTDIGLEDAAETAITTGLIWGLKTSILGVFFNKIKLEAQPQLSVIPQFNQSVFRTQFDCLLMIRMGYAIFAGMRLFVRISKVKGGIRTWKNAVTKT
jgi:hypothetical protein